MTTSSPDTEVFKVGTVVGVHGLDGAIKVRPGTNNFELLLDVETVTVKPIKNPEIACDVLSLRIEKGNLLLWLNHFSDRTAAESIIGAEVWTERSQIANLKEDEWWIKDLVGLAVYTTDGKHVGTVIDVITGSNELLEIRKLEGDENDTALVPFVKALVPVVDIRAKRIEISNLPGLID